MVHGICSVPDCGNVARLTLGYCPKHYQRWRKYGDVHYVTLRSRPALETFLAGFDNSDSACHEWRGPFDAFANHVGRVVGWGAYEEMIGANAGRIIAMVANEEAIGNGSVVGEFPGKACCAPAPAFGVENPVAV